STIAMSALCRKRTFNQPHRVDILRRGCIGSLPTQGRHGRSIKEGQGKAAASYNAAADHFDDEPLGFWDLIGTRTVNNLKLPAGAKILDVGCGTGASALPAAQAVGKNGFVVGVDLAGRLLDRARAKASAASLDNVDIRVADMTALNYPDES